MKTLLLKLIPSLKGWWKLKVQNYKGVRNKIVKGEIKKNCYNF